MRYWKFVALCFVSRIDKNKYNEKGDRLETLAAHVTLFKYTYCATMNNRTITEEQKQELITLIEEFKREHKTFNLILMLMMMVRLLNQVLLMKICRN